MRSRKSPGYVSNTICCTIFVAAIAFSNRSASGQSIIQQPKDTNSETASASAQPLSGAPSARMDSRLPPGREGDDHPLDREEHPPVSVVKLPLYILRDGIQIAVSPMYIRRGDLKWLLPLAGAAAVGFGTDQKTMTEVVSSNPSFNQTNVSVSDALRDGFIAAPIAMFGVGKLRHDEKSTETGLLGSEALIDAIVVDEVVKLCTFRERPLTDKGQGEFYIGSSGVDSSFVSGHTMVSWAAAAVIAGEYHSKWVQLGVYSAATGVGLTRVMGQQHFPSDVLIGAAGGWLIGHYVYRAHHHRVPAQPGN